MMTRPDLKGLTKEQLDYVSYLQDWITQFEASNIKKMILAIDEVTGIISDDIRLIAESKDEDDVLDARLQMLGSKKNKIYERFLSLIGQVKHFKSVGDMVNELKPNISDAKEAPNAEPVEAKQIRRNISDLAKSKKDAS